MNLEVRRLYKTYSSGVAAMNNINLFLEEGIIGLLGPNGAGKSTLMRTLATLQWPDKGTAIFAGRDIFKNSYEYRQGLGYLPQDFDVYPKQTASRLLHYFSLLKGIGEAKDRQMRVAQVLEQTGLSDQAHHRVSEFSGGMKQRFGIAQLLLNQPKMIIVDEPTAGLDPEERRKFLNVLREIGENAIIIVSTHHVEDVTELCRDLVIMDRGSVLLHQRPAAALRPLKNLVWQRELPEAQLSSLKKKYKLISSRYSGPGKALVRVFSESKPGEGYKPAQALLEDLYFVKIKNLTP